MCTRIKEATSSRNLGDGQCDGRGRAVDEGIGLPTFFKPREQ